MQLSAFAWLPFAMIGVGFIFILVCAIGLYLVLGRGNSDAADKGRYGVPYVPEDISARPSRAPYTQTAQPGYPIDPMTGQPVNPQAGYPTGSSPAATYPSPTSPALKGADQAKAAPATYCLQCGFAYENNNQQFCPRCGAKRTR